MNQPEALTIHKLWQEIIVVLQRRRRLMALTALSTWVAVYVGLLFVSDKYEAQESLLVSLGRENAEVPVTVERGTITSDGVRKEEINSYIALMTSRPLLLATIDGVGLQRFEAGPEHPANFFAWAKSSAKRAVRWGKQQVNELLIRLALRPRLSKREQVRLLLERSLEVYREKDSSVINLKLRLTDPVLAQDVLQVLTRQYLERHASLLRQADAVVQVFEAQTRSYGDQLGELRAAAAKLKAESGITSLNEQRLQRLDMLKAAEMGKQQNELDLARLKAEQTALAGRRPKVDERLVTSVVANPSAQQTKAKEMLAELQTKRAQALAKYQPDSEPVQKIEEQIAEMRLLADQAFSEDNGPKTYSLNPIAAHMDFQQEDNRVKMAAAEAASREADRQVAKIESDLRAMDQAETELQKLELEIDVAKARFLVNATKREEARTQTTMDRLRVANVSILSPATYEEKPVAPKRLIIMGLGVLAGILGGIALGLFLEWRNDPLYSGRDTKPESATAGKSPNPPPARGGTSATLALLLFLATNLWW